MNKRGKEDLKAIQSVEKFEREQAVRELNETIRQMELEMEEAKRRRQQNRAKMMVNTTITQFEGGGDAKGDNGSGGWK
ncbi:hypothetical protein ABW20_dc0107149 [Dactylellina cionopaga]|nr:hypothetical protein ABW20_dc0107149 [Dactylellina cionopaga]